MRIEETKFYTFDELSKEAKEKAKAKYYELEDDPWLEDDLNESLKDKACYWKEAKLQYSLSCCQGDGLSFSGTLDLKAFLAEFFPKMRRQNVMLEYIYKIYSTGNKGHYQYAAENQIDMDINVQPGPGKDYKRLDQQADIILERVKDEYMTVCKALEKEWYSILEYRMSDVEFSEHCEANTYEFYEDGKMF